MEPLLQAELDDIVMKSQLKINESHLLGSQMYLSLIINEGKEPHLEGSEWGH